MYQCFAANPELCKLGGVMRRQGEAFMARSSIRSMNIQLMRRHSLSGSWNEFGNRLPTFPLFGTSLARGKRKLRCREPPRISARYQEGVPFHYLLFRTNCAKSSQRMYPLRLASFAATDSFKVEPTEIEGTETSHGKGGESLNTSQSFPNSLLRRARLRVSVNCC